MERRKRPGAAPPRLLLPMTPPSISTSRIDRVVLWCFRHWLGLINTLVLLYGGLPWLAPLLVALGYAPLGELLFRLYTPLCHQRPVQSFFLLGHQVAFCHREAAMYTTLFIGGLIFAQVRQILRPISLRLTLLLLLPLALDGTTQLIGDLLPSLGLRGGSDAIGSLNWWLRMVTGLLFAVAIVLGVYPRLEQEFRGYFSHEQH